MYNYSPLTAVGAVEQIVAGHQRLSVTAGRLAPGTVQERWDLSIHSSSIRADLEIVVHDYLPLTVVAALYPAA